MKWFCVLDMSALRFSMPAPSRVAVRTATETLAVCDWDGQDKAEAAVAALDAASSSVVSRPFPADPTTHITANVALFDPNTGRITARNGTNTWHFNTPEHFAVPPTGVLAHLSDTSLVVDGHGPLRAVELRRSDLAEAWAAHNTSLRS